MAFVNWLVDHPLWAALFALILLTIYSAVGNALAATLRKRGYVEASETVLRWTPIASATRDKVLKYLVAALLVEVEKLELPSPARVTIKALRSYLALPEPPKDVPPGSSEPPSAPSDTIPAPPPSIPEDFASLRRASIAKFATVAMMGLALFVSVACTRQDRAKTADAVATAEPLCRLADAQLEQDWLTYVCDAASAIPGILRSLGTEDALDPSRPTGPQKIRIRREDRRTFEQIVELASVAQS